MDVSGSILRTWMPAIHTGMTHSVVSLLSMGERKLMEHFVVRPFSGCFWLLRGLVNGHALPSRRISDLGKGISIFLSRNFSTIA